MLKHNPTTLTVIIPTLNESAYLPQLLYALGKQTRKPDDVIVADAGSTDGTTELVRSKQITLVPGGTPARGRNSGAAHTNNDLLLFLDADVLPEPTFIADLLDEFLTRKLDMATCSVVPVDGNTIEKFVCMGTNLYFRATQKISPHAAGFCILTSRSFHEKLGGFNESLPISEDTDYARRGGQMGRFAVIPNVEIPFSVRRIKKEGLIRLSIKYAWCEVFALCRRPVRSIPFEYEFGAFSNRPCEPGKIDEAQSISSHFKKFIGNNFHL